MEVVVVVSAGFDPTRPEFDPVAVDRFLSRLGQEQARERTRVPSTAELGNRLRAIDDRAARVFPSPPLPAVQNPGLSIAGGSGGVSAHLADIDRAATLLDSGSGCATSIQEQCELVHQEIKVWALHMRTSVFERLDEASGAPLLADRIEGVVGRLNVHCVPAQECAWDAATAALLLSADLADLAEGARAAQRGYQRSEEMATKVIRAARAARTTQKSVGAMPGWLLFNPVSLLTTVQPVALMGVGALADKVRQMTGREPAVVSAISPANDFLVADTTESLMLTVPLLNAGRSRRGATERLTSAAGPLVDGIEGADGRQATVTEYAATDQAAAAPELSRPTTDLRSSLMRIENLYSRHGMKSGTVAVQKNILPDGRVTWAVMIPGTQGEVTEPHGFDWASNQRLAANQPAVSTQAVELAMDRAGIKKGEDVALIGHSQGGLIAVALAGQVGIGARFTIRDVVTAGSPTANQRTRTNVHYLHLETAQEAVSSVDGSRNPETVNRVTVRFNPDLAAASPGGDPDLKRFTVQGEAHSIPAHVAGLDLAAQSGHPSAQGALGRLDNYFGTSSQGPIEAQGLLGRGGGSAQVRYFVASAK